jgi:CHAT domain-containing protein/Tfp pilus assembly protein PilF
MIPRELAGGQIHLYQITLAAGQYLHLIVEQQGIDVVVVLFEPDGKQLVKVDGPYGPQGPESVHWVTEMAGSYRLEVRSLEKGANSGRYEVTITELRDANPQDNKRVAAQQSFTEGEQLIEEGTETSLRKALEKYRESLLLYQTIGDREQEATILSNIGVATRRLGDTTKAIDYYRQSLAIYHELGNNIGKANTLTNIAIAYHVLWEPQKALEHYGQALSLYQALKLKAGEAKILRHIGKIHQMLGQWERAIDFYERALVNIREAGEGSKAEALILHDTGMSYSSLGKKREALKYYEQVLFRYEALGDAVQEAIALNDIAAIHESLSEFDKALDYFKRALDIDQKLKIKDDEATVLNNIGAVYRSLRQDELALNYYNQALSLRRVIKDKPGEALTLANIASTEKRLGRLDNAQSHIDASLRTTESLRQKIFGMEQRVSYFATIQQDYALYVDILMQLHAQRPSGGYHKEALYVFERATARGILDLLAEARINIRHNTGEKLLTQAVKLQKLINDLSSEQTALLSKDHSEADAVSIAKRLADTIAQHEETIAQIRFISPRYAALAQPQPLTSSAIQEQVVDRNTLLLEYALGEEHSYLWAVTPTSITSHQLPPRAEIEAAARAVRELLIERQNKPDETKAQYQARMARVAESDANYWAQAAALSQMLIGPVASQLGAKRLLVVAPGALQYLPFAALPIPQGDGKTPENENQPKTFTPLIVEHEIINMPSASALAVLRRETAGRRPAPKEVALLADPVFDPNDERADHAGRDKTTSQNSKSTEPGQSRRFSRLRYTRAEAESILKMTPKATSLRAVGFQADKPTAVDGKLGQYRIVHFATHGLLDDQRPELSGVVMSLMDKEGRPQDGFLRLHEVYNLQLPVELVVLSACDVGLGKAIKGEGLVGLTRGFMYAGARRVVASLWSVDDQATAELMIRFYNGMLKKKMRPAAALRAAQIEMWKQSKSPYFWGAFVIQGEWK